MEQNNNNSMNNNQNNGEKTFTQDDVNRIVSARLAQEKAKGDAALSEREQQLAKRELKLTAKERLNEMGLPAELLDALDVSSPEALEKGLKVLHTAFNGKQKEPERKYTPFKLPEGDHDDSKIAEKELRKAMRLPD